MPTGLTVRTPTLEIGYEAHGDASGFPVVLLHGFPDDVRAWDAVVPPLVAAGYRVTPHWKIGTFRLDLVVEGDGKRLAIECDGDRYQPLEQLPEDMDRQSVLERMGWIFTRVRCSEFFRNPARAMKPVFEKLEILEIPPSRSSAEPQPASPISLDVIERIVRRAEDLQKAWSKGNGAKARSFPRTSASAIRTSV